MHWVLFEIFDEEFEVGEVVAADDVAGSRGVDVRQQLDVLLEDALEELQLESRQQWQTLF
jgi:hypothetical protein